MATFKDLAKESNEGTGGRADVYRIDPLKITVRDGWNPRIKDDVYWDSVHELKEDIRENGVHTPLRGFIEDDVLYASDGHRRLEAIGLLRAEGHIVATVPVLPDDRYMSDEDRLAATISRNSGVRLRPLEAAEVYKRLYNAGWSQAQIARKCGVTQASVSQGLELSAAPEAVKAFVREGEMSATTAREIVREAGNGTAAVEAAQEAVQAAKAAGKKRAVKPAKAKADALFFGILRNAFGCVDDRGDTVMIEIDREDYDKIMAVLGGSA